MSKLKNCNLIILVLLSFVSFFAFGCKDETPVDDIYFNLSSGQEQIVLLEGQTLNLNDFVVVQPSYASNTRYTLESFDSSIVVVSGNSITALKEGSTFIKVISNDNSKKQDVVSVAVEKDIIKLLPPNNLSYNPQTQSFTFDSVANAASYTLRINGEEFNLGNSTVFSLNNYANKFNQVLSAQVRANVASYSYVFKASEFTSEYKVYQSENATNISIVGGILKFNKSSNSYAEIYLNNALISTQTSNGVSVEYNLNNLPAEYAGKNVNIKIITKVKDEIKNLYGDSVSCYSSTESVVAASVLDAPEVSIKASTLSWNYVAGASKYKIYVDDVVCSETTNNSYNLLDLPNYESYVSGVNHEIKVIPVNEADSVNTLQTSKQNIAKFNRLATPTIALNETGVVWDSVSFAQVYELRLSYVGEGGVTQTISKTISNNNFSFENFEANEYTVEVYALAVKNGNISYLTSLKDETKSVKTFTKLSTTALNVENYVLNITTFGDTDYNVMIDNIALSSSEFVHSTNNIAVDLSEKTFAVNTHVITVVRKGDCLTSINSDPYTYDFVQLEAVNTISISNNVVSVTRSSINENATIKLETTGASLVDPKVTELLSMKFNTTDSGAEYFLGAGNYTTKVYVLGDGSKTFSANRGNETASLTFEVLAAPTLTFTDSAKAKISYTNNEKATSYAVWMNGEIKEEKNLTLECDFELHAGGTARFMVQANGNNGNILTSGYSNIITVKRLEDPTLTFDNDTNVISIEYNNNENLIEPTTCYSVSLKNSSKPDYESVNYQFGDEFTGFEIGENKVKTVLLSKLQYDDVYYLNANPVELTLTKLDHSTTFSVDANNKLRIVSENPDHYQVLLTFNFLDGSSKVFKANDAKTHLECGAIKLPYTYNNKEYIVDLLDADYMAIMPELNNDFQVKVKYIQPSTGDDSIINSEDSNLSGSLNLVHITKESLITTNTNNQLEITALEPHAMQYYIEVTFNIGGVPYTFKSNDDKNKLLYSTYELNYSYSGGTYTIDLLNNNYEPIFNLMTTNFNVSVQYFHKNTSSDVDSDVSASKAVELLPTATLVRNGQNIQFISPRDTYTQAHYSIIVNGTQKIDLDDSIIQNTNLLTIPFEYIYSRITGAQAETVYTLAVLTKNNETTDDNPLLSRKGSTISVKKQQALEIASYKFNNNEDGKNNNSVVIYFDTFEVAYKYDYRLTVNNGTGEEFVQDEVKVNTLESIEINLDSFDLLGTLKVSATLKTEGKDGLVEVFNSDVSNELSFIKIPAPTNIKVSDGRLTFDSVSSCVGYELYKKVASNYEKLNSGLITSNSYDVSELNITNDVVLKAVSISGGYTNSAYSEPFKIVQLAAPAVSVESGKIKVDIFNINQALTDLKADDNTTITLVISTDKDKYLSVNLKDVSGTGVSLDENILLIEPEQLLIYGESEIIKEKITLKYVVTYNSVDSENHYYANSLSTEFDAWGLFAPLNVKKAENGEGTQIESLSWMFNTLNSINSIGQINANIGYEFKIVYNNGDGEVSYYSTESELKYASGTSYLSYDKIIAGLTAQYPYGYDKNNDGDFEDEGDVIFGAGVYKVSVKSVPSSGLTGYNLCSSVYSEVCTFTIMAAPEISVANGEVVWDVVPGATSYILEVYDLEKEISTGDEVVLEKIPTTNAWFSDFATRDKAIRVRVRAISSALDILNSDFSNNVIAYRLSDVTDVSIEDGYFTFKASKYFTTAVMKFENAFESKPAIEVSINNAQIDEYLNSLESRLTSGNPLDVLNAINEIKVQYQYYVGITGTGLSLDDGKTYKVNTKLIGTTGGAVGFISSGERKSVRKLYTTKLSSVVTEVELGVLKFEKDPKYKSTTFRYNFNGQTNTNPTFWSTASVYKLNVEASGIPHTGFVLDYYDYIEAVTSGQLVEGDDYVEITGNGDLVAYVKFGEIILNVYEENTINLRDYAELFYYSTTIEFGESGLVYTSGTQAASINLLEGGSFIVDIFLVGGDEEETLDAESGDVENVVGYISSNGANLKTFIRYGGTQLTSDEGLLAVQDNKVFVEDITAVPNPDGSLPKVLLDYPVYKLVVLPVSANTSTKPKIIYLYYRNMGEDSAEALSNAKLVASRIDESGNADNIEYIEIEYSSNFENLILFNFSKYFEAANYTVTVQTLAGVGSGELDDRNYLLNSYISNGEIYYQFSRTDFSMKKGVLELSLSYVDNDLNRQLSYDYEICISDGTYEYFYTIGAGSTGVDIIGSKLNYNLPSTINAKLWNGSTFVNTTLNIDSGKTYYISARALTNAEKHINAQFSNIPCEVRKTSSAIDVDIVNGMLKWRVIDVENYKYSNIRIEDSNKTVNVIEGIVGTPVDDAEGNYLYHCYKFEDGEYSNGVNNFYIDSGETYSISVRVYSKDSNQIESEYSAPKNNIERLPSVEVDNIKAVDGILTWNKIDNAVAYLVEIKTATADLRFTAATNSLNLYEVDDDGKLLPAGEIASINITALGDMYITAKKSADAINFAKLQMVNNIDIVDGYVVWDPHNEATHYLVTFVYNNGASTESLISTENKALPSDNLFGEFSVYVQAFIQGENKKLISNRNEEIKIIIPRPEPVVKIEYISELFRMEWEVNDVEDIKGFEISYDFIEYTAQGAEDSKFVKELKLKQDVGFDYGKNCYYFTLFTIGEYRNFSVKVLTDGTVLSAGKIVDKADFNIYSYGNGEENNPYAIATADELLNIKHFAMQNRYFKLINGISLKDANYSINNGYIVAEEFNGVLDGNNCSIMYFAPNDIIQVNNLNQFAIFGKLTNATIKNLTIGNPEDTTTLLNSFDSDTTNDVKLSVLATEASGSTFNNLYVKGWKIQISAYIEDKNRLCEFAGLYIASFVAIDVGSKFIDCKSELELDIQAYRVVESYISGFVAKATNSTFKITSQSENPDITFNISGFTLTNGEHTYVAGLVAKMEGNNNEITNFKVLVSSDARIKTQYFGGLVAHLTKAIISNSITSSSSNLTWAALPTKFNFGGLVGYAAHIEILNSISNIKFNIRATTYTCNEAENSIGCIVGRIDAGTIKNCSYYTTADSALDQTTSNTQLGVYGYGNPSEVDGCEKVS